MCRGDGHPAYTGALIVGAKCRADLGKKNAWNLMGIRRKSGSVQYLVFRVVTASDRGLKHVFLTDKGTWTSRKALARKGTFSIMKRVILKLKAAYPDLILEQCGD